MRYMIEWYRICEPGKKKPFLDAKGMVELFEDHREAEERIRQLYADPVYLNYGFRAFKQV